MFEDKDIQKLIEVFITREEFKEAISNLATKEDINGLHTPLSHEMNNPTRVIPAITKRHSSDSS
jgi:hypothetical protein